jgi:hypothetical protein
MFYKSFKIEPVSPLVKRFFNGDEEAILQEKRGEYHRDNIYERFPELTEQIKEFTIAVVSKIIDKL